MSSFKDERGGRMEREKKGGGGGKERGERVGKRDRIDGCV